MYTLLPYRCHVLAMCMYAARESCDRLQLPMCVCSCIVMYIVYKYVCMYLCLRAKTCDCTVFVCAILCTRMCMQACKHATPELYGCGVCQRMYVFFLNFVYL